MGVKAFFVWGSTCPLFFITFAALTHIEKETVFGKLLNDDYYQITTRFLYNVQTYYVTYINTTYTSKHETNTQNFLYEDYEKKIATKEFPLLVTIKC